MKKIIYTTILITLFSGLSIAQETIIWLNGGKTDAEIIKKKAQMESYGYKVFINDSTEREKRHLAQPTPSGDEKFDRIFREGREAMDKEDWKQAVEKFNQVATEYPENKRVDAALYWLAYCYKKQKMYDKANETIDRLQEKYPKSTWTADALVLFYEMRSTNNPNIATSRPAVPRYPGSGQNPAIVTTDSKNVYIESDVVTFVGNTAQAKSQIDREDEIKLAAFQSLLTNDPPKAIETLARLLQSDSKASETLKTEVIRSTQGFRWTINRGKSESEALELIKQITPLLRNALIKGLQNQSSPKIRSEIIYGIARINDETSYNFLAQTYPNEQSKELKKAIINSFGGGNYTFYSAQANTPLEYWNGATWVNGRTENLATITTAPASAQSGTTNKTQATNPVRELRFNSLMTIFRTEKDLELRRLALGNIQRFSGWSTRDGMIDSLSQLYDSETDEQFKVSIIYSFANLTKNPQATKKLLEIAKNEKSDKMRLEAIRALRNNNSPEVIQFLESLIQ